MLDKIAQAGKGLVSGFLGGLKNSFQNAVPDFSGLVQASGGGADDPNETYYWQFSPPKQGDFKPSGGGEGKLHMVAGFGPAPRLLPLSNGNPGGQSSSGPTTHINVRDTHHWTESPRTARGEVPFMMLKENKILTNPMLNQMLNNVGSAITTVTGMEGKAKEAMDMAKEGGKLLQELQNGDEPGFEQLKRLRDKALQKQVTQTYAHPLEPYKGLYSTTPTGFKYTLPYMVDSYRQIANTFGEQSGGGMVADTVNAASSLIRNTLQDLSLDKIRQPGIYIEKPKAFTFSGREKTYTVNFPLFNTKTRGEIIKNWEFLFLLMYQNTPNRITRDLVDPPCIYEAKIPGVWYSKYSCIESMNVNFVGARREMALPIKFIESSGSGSSGSSTWQQQSRYITTVIPDAYDVTITVKELFSETQNFMYHMLNETVNNTTVTVNRRSV